MDNAKKNDAESNCNNGSETFYQRCKSVYLCVKKFSLREEITKTRFLINGALSHVPKAIVPQNNETILDIIRRPLYSISDECQQKFPYISMLSNSHGNLIVGSVVTVSTLLSASKLHNSYTLIK